MRIRRVGLRGRLLAAMLATAGVTLLVAAAALLPSLQSQLKRQSESNLRAATLASRPPIEEHLREATEQERSRDPQVATLAAEPDLFALQDAALALRNRVDGRVVVLDLTPTAVWDSENGSSLPRATIFRALVAGETVTGQEGDTAVVASPLSKRGEQVGLLVTQKRLSDVATAVDQVQRAFLTAALAGLAVAVLLATGLAATLVRRLRRLRQTALRITAEGPAAPAPRDPGNDEVGDLARALASMQEALQRQEQARRAFVATASHELRTPLTSLGWSLELLDEDLREDDPRLGDARAQVAGAHSQLRRLQRLAAELLDLSRLDADVELRREPVELGELARAVAAEFEQAARDQGVALEVVPPRGPCWAGGDPGAIARIVRILLDNAMRFAPEGTAIVVAPAYAGRVAAISVADAGPGVPEEERERIFERFERGSRTGGEGGFGLGLAIGRELAERQDGSLRLDAPAGAAGAGARFTLRLPIELPGGRGAARGAPADVAG
ncbi:MAG TPA: sensor histidine kinase [Solirubrobacteraceae bacterium]|nr:sensor histidine kinase [Solirubrobacteraceae bacterium]